MVDYEQQQQMDAEEEIMDESGEQRTVVRRLPKAKKTPTAIAFQIKVKDLFLIHLFIIEVEFGTTPMNIKWEYFSIHYHKHIILAMEHGCLSLKCCTIKM